MRPSGPAAGDAIAGPHSRRETSLRADVASATTAVSNASVRISWVCRLESDVAGEGMPAYSTPFVAREALGLIGARWGGLAYPDAPAKLEAAPVLSRGPGLLALLPALTRGEVPGVTEMPSP